MRIQLTSTTAFPQLSLPEEPRTTDPSAPHLRGAPRPAALERRPAPPPARTPPCAPQTGSGALPSPPTMAQRSLQVGRTASSPRFGGRRLLAAVGGGKVPFAFPHLRGAPRLISANDVAQQTLPFGLILVQ